MFSLFFSADVKPQSLSRFAQKKEATKIIEVLEKLQEKEDELKKSSDTLGVDSLAYAKYVILSKLLSHVNDSINDFNNKLALSNSIEELQEFINLLRELVEHIKEIYQNREYRDTLSKFRNRDRENAKAAWSYGVWGAIGAAFVYSGLVLGASTFLVGSGVDNLVDNKTEVYNPLPQTCILINQLLTTLDLTIKNLMLTLNLSQLVKHKVKLSVEDNMICPISKELMDNPYVCSIDGYSYQKEYLEKALYLFKRSPITQEPMKPNTTVEDNMTPNRDLKQLIDNHKLLQYVEMHKASDLKPLVMTK